MNRDQLEGKGKQIKGKINDAVGSLRGDASQELKGKGQQLGGKLQEGMGKVKEEGKRIMNEVRKDQRTEEDEL